MDDRSPLSADPGPGPSRRVAAWFDASPVELAGLAVLLLGALVVTGLVLWDAGRGPAGPPPAATVGGVVDPGHLDDHAAHATPPSMTDEPAEADEATVYVSGAVVTPGVVTLAAGSRVADAIAAVGGTLPTADTARLNLARPVSDGEQVHVPEVGEALPPPTVPAVTPGTDVEGRIDINRASRELLETLPGIGPAKADAIIAHRENEGPFTVPGDLRAVPGIGERTFQQLADLVTVG